MKCIAARCEKDSHEQAGRIICVEPDHDGWICEFCWNFMADGGVCSLSPDELKEVHLEKLNRKYAGKFSRRDLLRYLDYYGPTPPVISSDSKKCIVANCENHNHFDGRVICVEPDDDGWICELCWNFLIKGHENPRVNSMDAAIIADARMDAAMAEYVRCD